MCLAWGFFTLAASWVGAVFFNETIWYIRKTPGQMAVALALPAVFCLSKLVHSKDTTARNNSSRVGRRLLTACPIECKIPTNAHFRIATVSSRELSSILLTDVDTDPANRKRK